MAESDDEPTLSLHAMSAAAICLAGYLAPVVAEQDAPCGVAVVVADNPDECTQWIHNQTPLEHLGRAVVVNKGEEVPRCFPPLSGYELSVVDPATGEKTVLPKLLAVTAMSSTFQSAARLNLAETRAGELADAFARHLWRLWAADGAAKPITVLRLRRFATHAEVAFGPGPG